MILEKSNALKMKYEALKWLRLDQRCMFIATEVGAYSADVLGINEKKMVEIEIKVSITDLKADFKKYKHVTYAGLGILKSSQSQWVPNVFYFAVTEEILDDAITYLDSLGERAEKYGIICLTDWRVVKRAKMLHKVPPGNREKCVTALRMGSELIRFHEAWL